jgi:hypothetical protein
MPDQNLPPTIVMVHRFCQFDRIAVTRMSRIIFTLMELMFAGAPDRRVLAVFPCGALRSSLEDFAKCSTKGEAPRPLASKLGYFGRVVVKRDARFSVISYPQY